MRTFSGLVTSAENSIPDTLSIICTISEGKAFRILKAKSGTKFVILKTPVSPDSMSFELLKREYELSVGLNHPCIVSTLEFRKSTPAGPAIVMEYIEGKTLDEFIAVAPSVSARIEVLKDILDGLDYLHHKGVLHNDLKPDNIVVNSNGNARIIDFGLSTSDDSIYKGIYGGTCGYSAPEIINGRGPAGVTSDIYSIGLLINLIFGGTRYRKIARKCCCANPLSRPQTVAELRRKLLSHKKWPLFIAFAVLIGICTAISTLYPKMEDLIEEEHVYSLEEKFEMELAPRFNAAMELMKQQEYQEFAELVEREYFRYSNNFLDSLQKAYPMSDAGEIAPEIFAICAVNSRQRACADSIKSTLPSIEMLPPQKREELRKQIKALKSHKR